MRQSFVLFLKVFSRTVSTPVFLFWKLKDNSIRPLPLLCRRNQMQGLHGVEHELNGNGGQQQAHDSDGDVHGDRAEPTRSGRGEPQNEVTGS